MAFPFEFKFTYTVSDKNVYAAIMDVLTPNKDVLFVPEFTWLNLLVAVWIVGSVIYILWVMIKYYKAVKALKAPICQAMAPDPFPNDCNSGIPPTVPPPDPWANTPKYMHKPCGFP